MAHPKRKTSKSRRDKRRSHYKTTAPALGKCSNCGNAHQLHHVCPDCGYYRGKQAIEKEIV